MESLASWAFGFFGIEGIENDGFHQLPVDGFTTWAGCGFPIAILLFSLRFMVHIYTSISKPKSLRNQKKLRKNKL